MAGTAWWSSASLLPSQARRRLSERLDAHSVHWRHRHPGAVRRRGGGAQRLLGLLRAPHGASVAPVGVLVDMCGGLCLCGRMVWVVHVYSKTFQDEFWGVLGAPSLRAGH